MELDVYGRQRSLGLGSWWRLKQRNGKGTWRFLQGWAAGKQVLWEAEDLYAVSSKEPLSVGFTAFTWLATLADLSAPLTHFSWKWKCWFLPPLEIQLAKASPTHTNSHGLERCIANSPLALQVAKPGSISIIMNNHWAPPGIAFPDQASSDDR